MRFLHKSEVLSQGDGFRVHLRHSSARTMLMDDVNFDNYRRGRQFTAYGGWPRVSPVVIGVPHAGHWHLVVDLAGRSGYVEAGLEVIRNN